MSRTKESKKIPAHIQKKLNPVKAEPTPVKEPVAETIKLTPIKKKTKKKSKPKTDG